MIDVCGFVNSRDVAGHLRGLDYGFSMPEAAFIVYWSRDATLERRIDAWLEIAEEMPDRPMAARMNMAEIPSFRAFLHDYVDLTRRELERFHDAAGCVYALSWLEGDDWEDDDGLFGDVAGCVEHACATLGDEDGVCGFRLRKVRIGHPGAPTAGWLHLNRDFEATYVDCLDEGEADVRLALQFDGMWFSFPTPFRRGDIVVDARLRDPSPFVLDRLGTWERDELLANGFGESKRVVRGCERALARHAADGDSSDMGCFGFAIGEGFSSRGRHAWNDRVLYRDHLCYSHLDLEHFTGKLADSDLWAAVVSACLKGEVGFDEAANLLRYLEADSEARQLRAIYDARYPEEYFPNGVWRRIRREGPWTR